MAKASSWINAARLRTLPLSISGIIVGSSIAYYKGYFNLTVFLLAIGTTLGLQVLSNFANDYGDGVKGTDNEERIGPARAIQSGLITQRQMLTGIILTAVITLVLALLLIYHAFGANNLWTSLFFIVLGLGAIAAAIKYTVGNSAYGYKGMGDIFVFIFFGIVAVYGSLYLFLENHFLLALLPSIAIGLLSVAVLNLNNLRDSQSDERSGKITMVVKMGQRKAKGYHFFLIVGALLSLLIFSFLLQKEWNDLIYLFGFIPLLFHLRRVVKNSDPKLLDPELKIVALSTFAISVLFAAGLVWGGL